jgi:hypothetical protein
VFVCVCTSVCVCVCVCVFVCVCTSVCVCVCVCVYLQREEAEEAQAIVELDLPHSHIAAQLAQPAAHDANLQNHHKEGLSASMLVFSQSPQRQLANTDTGLNNHHTNLNNQSL